MASCKTSSSVVVVAACAAAAVGFVGWFGYWRRTKQVAQYSHHSAYESLIGNTPCILLPNLSEVVGRQIYVKMESWNPGGTGKDRAAACMIATAEASGLLPDPIKRGTEDFELTLHLHQGSFASADDGDSDMDLICEAMQHSITGGLVVEGTSGSTGIALAALAAVKGHACLVVLPDDQAGEKRVMLEVLGAVVHVVPTAAIANPNHYVNVASRLAARAASLGVQAVFINQFENLANFAVHFETTGPEIWRQCRPDTFVMSAGTGGTIAGVAKHLKENGKCRIVLVDPAGSVLYSKVEHGVAFASQQSERVLLRHRYDSIAEGIGLDRITKNMEQGLPFVDNAITVSDQEAVDMAHFILRHEGLLVGSSTAMNLVGAVRAALQLPSGSARVCTVICDSGQRHVTRFWNREFIHSRGLQWPRDGVGRIPECLQGVM